MDPPDNCPEAMYSMMCGCWKIEPTDRPSFPKLQQALAKSGGQWLASLLLVHVSNCLGQTLIHMIVHNLCQERPILLPKYVNSSSLVVLQYGMLRAAICFVAKFSIFWKKAWALYVHNTCIICSTGVCYRNFISFPLQEIPTLHSVVHNQSGRSLHHLIVSTTYCVTAIA